MQTGPRELPIQGGVTGHHQLQEPLCLLVLYFVPPPTPHNIHCTANSSISQRERKEEMKDEKIQAHHDSSGHGPKFAGHYFLLSGQR